MQLTRRIQSHLLHNIHDIDFPQVLGLPIRQWLIPMSLVSIRTYHFIIPDFFFGADFNSRWTSAGEPNDDLQEPRSEVQGGLDGVAGTTPKAARRMSPTRVRCPVSSHGITTPKYHLYLSINSKKTHLHERASIEVHTPIHTGTSYIHAYIRTVQLTFSLSHSLPTHCLI